MPDLRDVSAGADGHLSRDALIAWRDAGTGDRDRIVAHLAACEGCRREAASLERLRPADAAPARFDPADFVAQGYAAGGGGAASQSWRVRSIAAAVAAAAVLLLGALIVPGWLRGDHNAPPVVRGGETRVTLTRPVGVTVPVDALIFEWRADPPPDSARLLVFDLDRPADPLLRRDVASTRYEPTTEERQRLPRGRELVWFIEYRSGGATATTPSARFRVE